MNCKKILNGKVCFVSSKELKKIQEKNNLVVSKSQSESKISINLIDQKGNFKATAFAFFDNNSNNKKRINNIILITE